MKINLTAKQSETIRNKLAHEGKMANAKFRAEHSDYADRVLDIDDKLIIEAVIGNAMPTRQIIEDKSAQLADIRTKFVAADRDLFTLDRMTMVTDDGFAAEDKFVLKPWLFVKQSRTDKILYQLPKAEAEDLNSLVDIAGNEHQVLRNKRVFQLASDSEIENFAEKVEITLDLYLQLC